jgi:hypothetical protein
LRAVLVGKKVCERFTDLFEGLADHWCLDLSGKGDFEKLFKIVKELVTVEFTEGFDGSEVGFGAHDLCNILELTKIGDGLADLSVTALFFVVFGNKCWCLVDLFLNLASFVTVGFEGS